ncbi:MAG TPA: hypothetical protein VIM11_07750 [Tepidisphaeraceae bacterium]
MNRTAYGRLGDSNSCRRSHTWLLWIAVIAFATLGCREQRASIPSTKSETQAPAKSSPTRLIGVRPVAAIWWEHGGNAPPTGTAQLRKLIVGIWSDGTVVWSADRHFGGPPYTRGQIAVDKVGFLADRLNATGFFNLTRQVNFGPDASHTVIAAQMNGVSHWIGSWHDPSDPGIVVTERGLQSAADGPGDPPSASYKHFLKVWEDARTVLESSVPNSSVVTPSVDESVYTLGH